MFSFSHAHLTKLEPGLRSHGSSSKAACSGPGQVCRAGSWNCRYQDIELFMLLVYNRNRFLIIQVTPTSCVGHCKTSFLAVSLCPLLPTSCSHRSFRTRQPEGSNVQMHAYLGGFPVVSSCMYNENPTRDRHLQGPHDRPTFLTSTCMTLLLPYYIAANQTYLLLRHTSFFLTSIPLLFNK